MWATFDHQSVVVAGPYTIIFFGPHSAGTQMDALLDKIAPSLAIAAAGPPPEQGQRRADLLTRVAPYLLAGGALLCAVVWGVRRARLRSKAPLASRDTT
jgi:hypothetical protein